MPPFVEILKLKFDPAGSTRGLDAATGKMRDTQAGMAALKQGVAVAATAIGAALVAVGRQHEAASNVIAAATGESGESLDALNEDYRAVLGSGNRLRASTGDVAKAIGDLNTHTGATGPHLQTIATLALKAGLNTDILGQSFRRANTSAEEQVDVIDTLTVLGQRYGVNLDDIQKRVGNWSTRMEALDLNLKESVTLTAIARSEGRLMGDVLREMEAGTGQWQARLDEVMPSLDGVAGSTVAVYKETETLAHKFLIAKNNLMSYVSANPQVLQALGGMVSGIGGIVLVAPQAGAVMKLLWASSLGPIGLLVAAIVGIGAALWVFRDKVAGAGAWLLKFVAEKVAFLAEFLAKWVEKLPFGEKLAAKIRAAAVVGSNAINAGASSFERYRDRVVDAKTAVETLSGEGSAGGGAHRGGLPGATAAAAEHGLAVDALVDKWTGAKIDIKALDDGFAQLTDKQRANEAIMRDVMREYGAAREKLGPFNAELERLWQAEVDATAAAKALDEAAKALAVSEREAAAAAKEFAKEQEAAQRSADAAKDAFDRQREALLGLPTPKVIEDFGRLVGAWESLDEAERERATDEYGAALKRAAENGIELSEAQLAIVASAEGSGTRWAEGFFGTLSRAFEGGGGFIGGLKSLVSTGFGQLFSVAGGGAGGAFTDALKNVFSGSGFLGKIAGPLKKAGGLMSKVMSLGISGVPLVGPLLATFGPALLKGIGSLAGKVWGGIKRLFGGPSKKERAGRDLAKEIYAEMYEGLSDEQMAAHAQNLAGDRRLAVFFRVRDALMGARPTQAVADRAHAQADSLQQQLFRAEKQGAAAVQRVADRIQKILAEAKSDVTEVDETFESLVDKAAAVNVGELALTGHTEDSLARLKVAALDLYASAGSAAEQWSRVTQGAVDRVRDSMQAFAETASAAVGFADRAVRSASGLRDTSLAIRLESVVNLDGKRLGDALSTNIRGARIRAGEL